MSRLFRVEVRRLLSRRAIKLLLLLPLVVFAVELSITIPTHSKDLANAQRQAQQRYDRATANTNPQGNPDQACKTITRDVIPVPAPAQSAAVPVPTVNPSRSTSTQVICQQLAVADFFTDPRLHYGAEVKTGLEIGVVLFALVGFLVGTTGIGAEWAAGTFAYLLTWAPQRWRVLLAKTGALIAVVFATMAVTLAMEVGFQWIAASASGTFADGQGIAKSVTEAARGLAVVFATICLGAATAGLARNSSAALGVLLGYLVGIEAILRNVFPKLNPWTLVNNAQAVVVGHISVPTSRSGSHHVTLHSSSSMIKLIILGILVTAVSGFVLSRRDVT